MPVSDTSDNNAMVHVPASPTTSERTKLSDESGAYTAGDEEEDPSLQNELVSIDHLEPEYPLEQLFRSCVVWWANREVEQQPRHGR